MAARSNRAGPRLGCLERRGDRAEQGTQPETDQRSGSSLSAEYNKHNNILQFVGKVIEGNELLFTFGLSGENFLVKFV